MNGTNQNFVYDGANILKESGAVNATYINALGVDEPLARRGTQNEYYLMEVLGSVAALADGNGCVSTFKVGKCSKATLPNQAGIRSSGLPRQRCM